MPFLAHFDLTERPFSLTPNCELYFPSETHQEVLNSLRYAIDRGEGIIKVSGEVGTGKTLICRLLTADLVKTKAVAYIINPQNDADWVVGAVCREFGLDPDSSSDPFHLLNGFLLEQYRKGRPAVLVVDEAQALGLVGLETVRRRLSNLETDTSKLLQAVLFGQPELDRLLRTHTLRQLNQRIVFSFTIPPFSVEDHSRLHPLSGHPQQRQPCHRRQAFRRQGAAPDRPCEPGNSARGERPSPTRVCWPHLATAPCMCASPMSTRRSPIRIVS